MPGRGEIDNGKPPMTQADATIGRPPLAGIVRAAVAQGIAPERQPAAIGNGGSGSDAYNAAHMRFLNFIVMAACTSSADLALSNTPYNSLRLF